MEKRLLLFVVLSSMILLFWNMFLVPKTPQQTMKPATTSTVPLPEVQVEEKETAPKNLVTYSAGKMEIVFDEDRAAISEVVFNEYQAFKFPLVMGFAMDNKLIFKKSKISSNVASFLYADKEKEISKNFIFSKDKYHIILEINVQNLSNANIDVKLPVILGSLDSVGDSEAARFRDFTVSLPEKLLHPNIHKDQIFNQFNFLGLRDRYFCAIIEAPQENYSGYIKKIDAKNSIIGLASKVFVVNPGQSIKQSFQIYLGPQQIKLISEINPAWAGIVHFGTFDFISQLLLQLLDILYNFGHSWGLAIIILSILIYVALYPLSIKQMRSMKEMQALQPRIEELRKAYKDNPQKLNVAVMALYKEHKVNPLGGCLPLILQMPIFFALYQALMRSVELKGASFLWIKDLSEPDKLFHFPFSLPILGGDFNVLPILMMIGMFIQQKLSMSASSAASGDQQKLMLIIMPIMFGVIFYNMPSGLVLYWFVNSTLMLVNQIKIAKTK